MMQFVQQVPDQQREIGGKSRQLLVKRHCAGQRLLDWSAREKWVTQSGRSFF